MAVATDLEVHLAQMLPATFTKKGLTEAEYFALCAKFDNSFVVSGEGPIAGFVLRCDRVFIQ